MDYILAFIIASGILIITQPVKRRLRKSLQRKVTYKFFSGIMPL